MFTHRAGLLQQLIDEGGFAMIDVGDDGDISEIVNHGCFQLGKRAQVTRFGRVKQCFYKKNSKINQSSITVSGVCSAMYKQRTVTGRILARVEIRTVPAKRRALVIR
jgi:hypothetical protein